MPGIYAADTTAGLWKESDVSKRDKEEVQAEGQQYRERLQHHVQFVFSRVQHRWHALQNGKRVPLKYCLGAGSKRACRKKGCRESFRRLSNVHYMRNSFALGLRKSMACESLAARTRFAPSSRGGVARG